MRRKRLWIRLLSPLVPRRRRADWVEEWEGELDAAGTRAGAAWGALHDAWYLRTEGWTMGGMWRDVRLAVRGLVRRPFFTALAGVTLAVGIGANTAIFSVVDGVLLDPLPFPEADEVVSVNHVAPGLGSVPVVPHSEGTYLHYHEGMETLEAFAVYDDQDVSLMVEGEPLRLEAARVTVDFFRVAGIQPRLGRAFAPGEDRVGAEPVVVLSDAVWRTSFGADPAAVGRVVELDGRMRRIVGVMPTGFDFPEDRTQVWIPLELDDVEPDLGSFGMIGVGRLAEGATPETATREMDQLLWRFADLHPEDLPRSALEQAGMAGSVRPFTEIYVQDVRQALWVVLGTVGFVLLIACANVANLFLVRAEARRREQAVRTALGAGRGDMIRMYLTESVTLALGGGVLGLLLASGGVELLLRLAPVSVPRASSIDIDGSVLLFTLAVSVASGLLFGLFPILGYGRGDLGGSLKEGGRGGMEGREGQRVRKGLVVAQVALALVLLVGSGLMARSFQALSRVDPGFEPEGRLTFDLALSEAEYPDAESGRQLYRAVEERLAALPGVEAVGLSGSLPLTGSKSAGPMEAADDPVPEGELGPMVDRGQAGPGYFEAMGIRLLEGRTFTEDDAGDGYRAVVVGRSIAERYWPGESALGKRIRNQGGEHDWEVVGVVEDVHYESLAQGATPYLYHPLVFGTPEDPATTRGLSVTLAVAGDPLSVLPAVRDAMREVAPRLPLVNPRSMETVMSEAMSATSFTVVLLGIAAGIALLLGTVGIYGVISYMVTRRTREIGVRMALGAPAGLVRRSVVGEGMALAGVGLVVGLAAAWALSRVLATLLFGVSATDPLTYAATAGLLAGVALLAAWVPAHRASRVDPARALRAE